MSDNISIFNYVNDIWDKKYLSLSLLSTDYQYKLISDKKSMGLFTMPLMSKTFCKELVDKLTDFDGWTNNRHAYFPTNDVLLKEYDTKLFNIHDATIRNICLPAVNELFDANMKAEKLEHETFIVRYTPGNQSGLKLHHDNSTFSLVLNLSDLSDYEGGGTYFVEHSVLLKEDAGTLVIHPGQLTHKHGVRPITSGERYVIVSFCKMPLNIIK